MFKLSQDDFESKSVDLLSDRSSNNFILKESCEEIPSCPNKLNDNILSQNLCRGFELSGNPFETDKKAIDSR